MEIFENEQLAPIVIIVVLFIILLLFFRSFLKSNRDNKALKSRLEPISETDSLINIIFFIKEKEVGLVLVELLNSGLFNKMIWVKETIFPITLYKGEYFTIKKESDGVLYLQQMEYNTTYDDYIKKGSENQIKKS